MLQERPNKKKGGKFPGIILLYHNPLILILDCIESLHSTIKDNKTHILMLPSHSTQHLEPFIAAVFQAASEVKTFST